MPARFKPRREIHELVNELQVELDTYAPNVVICGESPCRSLIERRLACVDCPDRTRSACLYHLRQRMKERLNSEGCLATTFEDSEGIAYASMDEKLILLRDDVDLVFVIPSSEGSISELSSFAEDDRIRPKLRVLVPYVYHPFYGSSSSYVTSVYEELMAEYGQVYPFALGGGVHPDPLDVASTLVAVYKRRRLLELRRGQ